MKHIVNHYDDNWYDEFYEEFESHLDPEYMIREGAIINNGERGWLNLANVYPYVNYKDSRLQHYCWLGHP